MSRCLGARSVTSRPPISIAPSETSSRPAIMRSSVDFPHPDGPTRTTNSPSSISSETSSTATTSAANRFVTWTNPIPATRRWYSPKHAKTRPRSGRTYGLVLTTTDASRRLRAMKATPATEARNITGAELDLLSTAELVMLMNREDALVPAAVGAAGQAVADVVDAVAERLRAGGRLVYAGAGTSGSLAPLDASECEATFGIGCDQVVAAVAGAAAQSSCEREAAEDDATAGRHALQELNVGAKDAVVAVSASGGTPFTLGAARAAARAGAFTACVVCVPHSQLAAVCEREIMVLVGPEILAGSTRLKAGTAQKLVLNTISTVAMMRLGKTYAGLMVGVVASNEKLRERVRRIVSEATGAPSEAIDAALAASGGDAKVAIVSLLGGIDTDTARARLEVAGDNVREALGR